MSFFDNWDPPTSFQPETFEQWDGRDDLTIVVYEQNGWSMVPKGASIPWEQGHIFYNLDLAQKEQPTRVSEQSITVDNSGGGSSSQTLALTYTKAVSTGKHEDSTHGWSNSIGGEVDATESLGIPFIEKTTVSIKTTYNHTDSNSRTWGDSISTTETISVNDPVTAAPGEIIQGDAILLNQKFAVPYMLWKFTKDHNFGGAGKSGGIGILVKTFGIFRGESSYDLEAKFTKMN